MSQKVGFILLHSQVSWIAYDRFIYEQKRLLLLCSSILKLSGVLKRNAKKDMGITLNRYQHSRHLKALARKLRSQNEQRPCVENPKTPTRIIKEFCKS